MAKEKEKSKTNHKIILSINNYIYLSLIVLIVSITCFLTVLSKNYEQCEHFAKFQKQKYIMMIVLFMLLLIHMAVNLMGFQNKCGGSISNNIGKVLAHLFLGY